MDTSMNASQEPFRAFIGDKLPHEQRTLGFAVQSFFVGIGAVAAASLPWLLANAFDVANTAPAGQVPDTVRFAFYTGTGLILVTVLWSVVSTPEYSPEEMRRYHEEDPTVFHVEEGVGLRQIVRDLANMSREMKQLALVQFFSWFGMIALWIYGTPAVTAWHFGTADVTGEAYNRGANWLGVLIACYNGVAALFALFIPRLVRRFGSRGAHCLHMLFGGICLASFWWVRDPLLLLPLMIGVGIAWASILSIPYSMLSSILPHRKMGIYMGFFNWFVVLPQVLAALALGALLRWLFDGQAIYALVLGGLSLALAGLAVLRVDASADLGRRGG
jgi:maltose/moltooligosaccharide transporter